ncbi:zinc-binding dehydrogenase [Lacticaseibacillus kribbianus]|uniref:zinc-binding dehydrogenase n=1 Tax=Lacticaseibacillus kribbianus TaxID=2926292 RepID=UPI001CD1E70F|nr:zinc-binding dehydrogenase [Lacticaseibacillus kribbianus]
MMNQEIEITGTRQVRLHAVEQAPLHPGEVRVQSLISLVSTGSELGPFNNAEGDMDFPVRPGYTVIGKVVETQAPALPLGGLVLADYPHAAFGVMKAADCISLDADSNLETVIFARMAAVSMSSIVDTTVKPLESVLVLGLGMVGNFACQILTHLGYNVVAVDRDPARRAFVAAHTDIATFASVSALAAANPAPFGLLLECTGVDTLLLAALPLVRKRGEVYQIGVPWRAYGDAGAHELLRAVFYGFITLKSGWEWFLPAHADEYAWYGHADNVRQAAAWLNAGVLSVAGQAVFYKPADCQAAYTALADHTESRSVIFDWR